MGGLFNRVLNHVGISEQGEGVGCRVRTVKYATLSQPSLVPCFCFLQKSRTRLRVVRGPAMQHVSHYD